MPVFNFSDLLLNFTTVIPNRCYTYEYYIDIEYLKLINKLLTHIYSLPTESAPGNWLFQKLNKHIHSQ